MNSVDDVMIVILVGVMAIFTLIGVHAMGVRNAKEVDPTQHRQVTEMPANYACWDRSTYIICLPRPK